MAKDKLQKRKEALERQRLHLITRVIPQWIAAAKLGEDDRKLINDQLISSAYAARCDRHGNYLDRYYYKNVPPDWRGMKETASNIEYAIHSTVLTLEQMKNEIDWGTGRTLYDIAYKS